MRELFEQFIVQNYKTIKQVFWEENDGPFYLSAYNSSQKFGVPVGLNDLWEAFKAGYTTKQNKEEK